MSEIDLDTRISFIDSFCLYIGSLYSPVCHGLGALHVHDACVLQTLQIYIIHSLFRIWKANKIRAIQKKIDILLLDLFLVQIAFH